MAKVDYSNHVKIEEEKNLVTLSLNQVTPINFFDFGVNMLAVFSYYKYILAVFCLDLVSIILPDSDTRELITEPVNRKQKFQHNNVTVHRLKRRLNRYVDKSPEKT